jgi:hypothetical protein
MVSPRVPSNHGLEDVFDTHLAPIPSRDCRRHAVSVGSGRHLARTPSHEHWSVRAADDRARHAPGEPTASYGTPRLPSPERGLPGDVGEVLAAMTHGSATVPDPLHPLQRHDVGACELPFPRELEPVAFAMRQERNCCSLAQSRELDD